MSAHTKGPWVAIPSWDAQNSPVFEVLSPGGDVDGDAFIAEVDGSADAHLVAAAPELLEALKSLQACLDALVQERPMLAAKLACSTTVGNALANTRAAIAKAEGK